MNNGIMKQAWNESYNRKENHVFYPNEEIIRFSAKYIAKRVGLNEYSYKVEDLKDIKVLDLGCGIGRHIIFFEQMKINTFGIDLSSEAISIAKKWAKSEGVKEIDSKIIEGDITILPWENESFHFIVSHGVIDSMSFKTAKKVFKEVHRVMKNEGLFYCDLISGDNSSYFKEFAGEEIVSTVHEQGTIQSFFNYTKIKDLCDQLFDLKECKLIKHEQCLERGFYSRYHLVLKKLT